MGEYVWYLLSTENLFCFNLCGELRVGYGVLVSADCVIYNRHHYCLPAHIGGLCMHSIGGILLMNILFLGAP
jgi:hypothetical protein